MKSQRNCVLALCQLYLYSLVFWLLSGFLTSPAAWCDQYYLMPPLASVKHLVLVITVAIIGRVGVVCTT